MRKIKMVGLDLDGTVFDDQKQISLRNKEVIAKAVEQGVVVLPATGRPPIGLPKDFIDIPGIAYAITSNGGAVYDLRTQKTIYTDCISNAQAISITEKLIQEGMAPEVYVDGKCYIDEDRYDDVLAYHLPQAIMDYVKASRTSVKNLVDFLKDTGKDVHKMHVLFDSKKPEVRKAAFEIMKQFDGLTVCSAFAYNMEINSETADKGTAMLALGKLLGIEKEEIMAMGDGENDLPMLTKVGFSVAMGNASEKVKANADAVTLTNNEDGVAAALEKWVLTVEK